MRDGVIVKLLDRFWMHDPLLGKEERSVERIYHRHTDGISVCMVSPNCIYFYGFLRITFKSESFDLCHYTEYANMQSFKNTSKNL